MKDKLEQFIHDHKEEFDSFEPNPELWKKIIPTETQETKVVELKPKVNWKTQLLRVAAILLIAFISIFTYKQFEKPKVLPLATVADEKNDLDPEIQELLEAESYYSNEVDLKLKELESYSVEFAAFKEEILGDIAMLDSAYLELKVELGDDINKREVVEQMIQNYRLKLDLLEEILKQFDTAKKEEEKFDKQA